LKRLKAGFRSNTGKLENEPGALLLNAKQEPLAWHVVSRGCLDAPLVHPREVIKAVCLANGAGVIVAHNHPSGDPEPSGADIVLSQRLSAALKLVGVDLLDAIVIGEAGRYSSLRERGQLEGRGRCE